MKGRCNDPNNCRYHVYGGAGVKICDRWMSFTSFLADMGERPVGTSLGRIGDTGHYEPGNCAWQTPEEQGRKGSRNPRTKLSEEQVLCIRSLYAPKARRGCSAKNIAADLGVNTPVIDCIVSYSTWRHI